MKYKLLFRTLLVGWAIGLSARFIFEYFRGSVYITNTFDLFFDWGGLLILGIINLFLNAKELVEVLS